MRKLNNMITHRYPLLLITVAALSAMSCGNKTASDDHGVDSDSLAALVLEPLPVKVQESMNGQTYKIVVHDSAHDGTVNSLKNLYDGENGWFTFRGNPQRTADYGGTIKGTPTKVVQQWVFSTPYDGTHTSMGTWGGGTGWTGQPVFVRWPEKVAEQFRGTATAKLTADFDREEVILGSLCGKVYFLNFKTGKPSREPINVVNPIKGSVSLDPTLNGNLYVGHGIPKEPPMSQLALSLFKHEITFRSGADINGGIGWTAADSSPVRVGQFLFWPRESGVIYKYYIDGDKLVKHTTLRVFPKEDGYPAGTENSLCVYRNYGYFGTNRGDVYCIDLNTMKPLWHYDNVDDIDGSIVCEEENGIPYIYCGCEVDRQGDKGICHLVKLNGMDGKVVWEDKLNCRKLNLHGKHFDGGLYCSPLFGKGDCKDLVFMSICQHETSSNADFMAIEKKTGKIRYSTRLRAFAWSSPIGFVNEKGHEYIFTGDSSGYGYIIEGATGKVLFRELLAGNFESSPVVVGNEFVVGSRGTNIYKFRIE